ncbi:Ring hydroxylating alpha subunit (catalytic domain) [Streptomyces sp. SceaMP-e96]|nr:Ring hydroxylating alpha subunit (catalytic domain) [Streptomyces sp. SceaMP-e96]
MHPEAATAPTEQAAPGQALPARYYTDPAAAAAETRHLFAKSWQLVCHESDLPGPGARLAATLADREVLVVRTENGTLAGHLNVCRHRGTRLVSAPEASGKAIRCPYHGWTYKLDGRLVGAPEARQIPCLDKPALGLFPVRVESFLGFVFANLDPDAVPLAEQCAGLAEAVGHYAGTDLVPVGRSRIHDLAGAEVQHANWKVAVDNYLEGYHVPVAHPGLMRLLDYQGYTSEIDESYVLFASPLRDKPSSNWAERLYQRLASHAGSDRGRPAGLAVRGDLPQHTHRLLPRPCACLDRHTDGGRPGGRPRRLLHAPRDERTDPARAPAQHPHRLDHQ